MAVSKRLRFEIFRRDNFTCRYCGRSAPEVVLRPDHVVPEALGGRADPSNLVTSCEDCNSGKSATPPDAPLVAQVAEDAARWAAAQKVVAGRMAGELVQRAQLHVRFETAWGRVPLPDDWPRSIDTFLAAGLPIEVLLDAAQRAVGNRKVLARDAFRYMCGIAWARVNAMREETAALVGASADSSGAVDGAESGEAQSFASVLFAHLDEWEVERATEALRAAAEHYGEPVPVGEELTERMVEQVFTDLIYRADIAWRLLGELMNAVPASVVDESVRKAEQILGTDYDSMELVPRAAFHVIAAIRTAQINFNAG